MGQGSLKNHKKYRNDFCSANNCKKCLIVEINFFFAKCRLHSVYGSLSVNFNQGSLLYEFQRIMFLTFLRHQRGIPKGDFNHWFLSESLTMSTVNIFGGQDLQSPIFDFYELFCWDIHSLFCSNLLPIFLNTWKNHWVPILSNVQPAVKTGTQLFQQLGDTQKSQAFLKGKNCSGVRPSLFKKKKSVFCANYFTLDSSSCADFLCSQ